MINPPKNTRGSNVPAMYYLHGLADGDAPGAGDGTAGARDLRPTAGSDGFITLT